MLKNILKINMYSQGTIRYYYFTLAYYYLIVFGCLNVLVHNKPRFGKQIREPFLEYTSNSQPVLPWKCIDVMWGSDKICKTWSTALQTLPFTLPSSIIYDPYKMRKHRFLTAVTACLEEINGYLVKVTIFIISCVFIILSAMKKVPLKDFKHFHIFYRVTNISKSLVSVDVVVSKQEEIYF